MTNTPEFKDTGIISAASPETQFKLALDQRYRVAQQTLYHQPTTYESLEEIMRTNNGLNEYGQGDEQLFALVSSFLPRLYTPIEQMAQNGQLRQIFDDILVQLPYTVYEEKYDDSYRRVMAAQERQVIFEYILTRLKLRNPVFFIDDEMQARSEVEEDIDYLIRQFVNTNAQDIHKAAEMYAQDAMRKTIASPLSIQVAESFTKASELSGQIVALGNKVVSGWKKSINDKFWVVYNNVEDTDSRPLTLDRINLTQILSDKNLPITDFIMRHAHFFVHNTNPHIIKLFSHLSADEITEYDVQMFRQIDIPRSFANRITLNSDLENAVIPESEMISIWQTRRIHPHKWLRFLQMVEMALRNKRKLNFSNSPASQDLDDERVVRNRMVFEQYPDRDVRRIQGIKDNDTWYHATRKSRHNLSKRRLIDLIRQEINFHRTATN